MTGYQFTQDFVMTFSRFRAHRQHINKNLWQAATVAHADKSHGQQFAQGWFIGNDGIKLAVLPCLEMIETHGYDGQVFPFQSAKFQYFGEHDGP